MARSREAAGVTGKRALRRVAEQGDGGVRSVSRALALLTALNADGLTLTEAAGRADVPLPTALRLIRTLESEGFAARLDTGQFVLGPAAIRLAYEADPEGPLRWTVRDAVGRLRDEIGETCGFFVRRGDERLCLESAQSCQEVRWVCLRGTRGKLHTTAAGKVLMAFGPTDELVQRVPQASGRYECSGGRLRTIAELRDELHEIRHHAAVATDDQESSEELWAFALPFVVRGVCLGAFEFAMPRERSRGDRTTMIAGCTEIVRSLSDAIATHSLGVSQA